METGSDTPPLIAIVGETASGKTKLALDLARKFNGEIICADSWTVRREVDIGTAKPSYEELREVPHHLVDIVEPCEDFTAAVFKRLANKAIADISSRGKLPVVVGGTGLYIDGVIFDYSFMPAAGKKLREELGAMTIWQLLSLIKQRNYPLDGIDIRNKRRLMRLIETGGARPTREGMRTNTLVIGMKLDKDLLKQRITERVENMLAAGLENEVRQLSETYGWECEALKGIGYQEWREYFSGLQKLGEVKSRIINDTLGLAKRQRTWFKRNKNIVWISKPEEAVELTATFLNK